MDATKRKRNGVHYTPLALAGFLARQTAGCFAGGNPKSLAILDPACGDGQLLAALIDALLERSLTVGQVVGLDTDSEAVAQAQTRLERYNIANVRILCNDFLCHDFSVERFDCVIANPPYVRTQHLGGEAAQALARKFELKGRVDLYQAFTVAISSVLSPGGVLGLLTSNRFLSVRSGAAMRGFLRNQFDLKQIFDLGDTRLFDAAVLPVVVTGTKRRSDCQSNFSVGFHRVYRVDGTSSRDDTDDLHLLAAFEDAQYSGVVETATGEFLIERGELLAAEHDSVWTLSNLETRQWLDCLRRHQVSRFGDLADIKVGIKTTADAVFIRDDWDTLGSEQPERNCVVPLITHHVSSRWSIQPPEKKVLYPYDLQQQKRLPLPLSEFPRASAYLGRHRERLGSRKYVVDSGRDWFEIWVPHQPADWAKPKIVWPDISEQPRFFLDTSGAIVNGDCYWIKLRADVDPDWLYLMLGVANSQISTKFYDTVFHNKLYAGRRRFMTQYVKEFPLPALDSKLGRQIVKIVKRLVDRPNRHDEVKLEGKVQSAFGFD